MNKRKAALIRILVFIGFIVMLSIIVFGIYVVIDSIRNSHNQEEKVLPPEPEKNTPPEPETTKPPNPE